METHKKLYKREDVELCRDYVFGYTRFFRNYKIISNDFDIYLVGDNQINKKDLFISINKSDFLKECKKFGRYLCNILLNDLNKHFEEVNNSFENVIFIEPYLINFDNIKKNRDEIIKIIKPFILEYGIPVNYELSNSLYSDTIAITTSIGLRELCTYFILINIISDLAYFNKRGIKIDTYYSLFNLNKAENCERIISKLFNVELLHSQHVGEYYIKYIDSNPVCYTPNLFTFAFEQLKHSILKRKNNITISTEITSNRKKIPKSIKELSRKSSANYFVRQKNDYKKLKKYRNIIKKYDINHEYASLISKLDEIQKIKDIKRNIHSQLIEEAYHVAYKLKNGDKRK